MGPGFVMLWRAEVVTGGVFDLATAGVSGSRVGKLATNKTAPKSTSQDRSFLSGKEKSLPDRVGYFRAAPSNAWGLPAVFAKGLHRRSRP